MKVVFKIFTVKEKWFREAGQNSDGSADDIITTLEDWGSEFESEEGALLHLATTIANREELSENRKPEEVIIQKIITI